MKKNLRDCPKCGTRMLDADHYFHDGYKGQRCYKCGFNIFDGETEAEIQARLRR